MRTNQQSEEKIAPYKFKELKVYNSTEYLWGNAKKYRQVFDRHETAYVYVELSLFNKQFDREDWSLHVELKCFRVEENGRKEICKLTIDKAVSRFDHVIYLREGWGKERQGTFWQAGAYYWEAVIEGSKVGSKHFYIIETEAATDHDDGFEYEDGRASDEYLELTSVQLYEGPYDDVTEADRIYLQEFSSQESRYIYVELQFRNLQPNQDWQLELFTKFKNQAGEIKGQVTRLHHISAGQASFKIAAGWGAASPNLWRPDAYTADIVFLDNLLATVLFTVDDEAIEGSPQVLLPGTYIPQVLTPADKPRQTFEEIMSELRALIGLQEVKQQVSDHAIYLKFLQLRKRRGFKTGERVDVHSVFSGNPGTGKTTVARMMGRLYHSMGLLSRGHTVVADRVDLVGEYIGQTAPKTREVIEDARGGVLFIDEAYALSRGNDDGKDFGREVIELLVKEMSNGPGDLAVIVAGYPEEMGKFLASNTGLKSRFKHHYDFRNFLPQELSLIAGYAARRQEVRFTLKAKAALDERITLAFRQRDRTFGNARYVHDLVEQAKIRMALRLMQGDATGESYSKETLSTVNVADVKSIGQPVQGSRPDIPVNEQLLTEGLTELDALVGMDNIKVQLHELVSLVRYYRRTDRDVLNAFQLHTVLLGNPGTGKTTVARLLSKLYNALGILERGHIVETDRQGLVAGYVGQTADKTAGVIDKALGGVLFIDEAYALTQTASQRGDFGDEAVQTLLKRMEDQRGEFFVCVAGYPDNMDQFLKANPGLSSRFDKILRFEDYTPGELLRIAEDMFRQRSTVLTAPARAHMSDYLGFLHTYRDRYFGNARTVRRLVEDVLKRHDLRRASQVEANPTTVRRNGKITRADVDHLILDTKELSLQRKRIGF